MEKTMNKSIKLEKHLIFRKKNLKKIKKTKKLNKYNAVENAIKH